MTEQTCGPRGGAAARLQTKARAFEFGVLGFFQTSRPERAHDNPLASLIESLRRLQNAEFGPSNHYRAAVAQ